jgi:hypothetical protein
MAGSVRKSVELPGFRRSALLLACLPLAMVSGPAFAESVAGDPTAFSPTERPLISYQMDAITTSAEDFQNQVSGNPTGIVSKGSKAAFVEDEGDLIETVDVGKLLDERLEPSAHIAFGIEASASTDSSATDVVRLGYLALLDYVDPFEYLGVTIEGVWIKPTENGTDFSKRIYIEVANNLGEWDYDARVGTDGYTIVGYASINNEDWSQRYFIDRDIVETFDGVDLAIYYTELGAELRSYLDSRNTLNYGVGLIEYVGKNTTYYAEAGYTHKFPGKLGLNAQLQMRYEHSTFPNEFDYYAPKNRVEIMPILALTRYSENWSYSFEAGYGLQRDSESAWQDLRYAQLWLSSPDVDSGISFEGSITYSNTSLQSGPNFDYVGGNIGLLAAF